MRVPFASEPAAAGPARNAAMTDMRSPKENPRLYLEIVKGSTQFPNRPVYEGVFLIGAGTNCDLRLGGTDTPAVHSVVRAEDGEVHIESLSRKPVLRVNGNPCERTVLMSGDRIQIGSIHMVARFQTMAVEAALNPVVMKDDREAGNLKAMSASELIDLLEHDLSLVEEHDTNRVAGAERLLDEALRRTEDVAAGDHGLRIVDPDEDLRDTHAEAEQLIIALNRVADDLYSRVDNLRQTEEVYSEAAEELLAMQNRFASLLERVLVRLEAKDQQQRKSA